MIEPCLDKLARILVVDDLEHNRQLFQTFLRRAEYAVDVAENGQEAVAAVGARDYDLVLMDIQMPGMDGLAATRAIRQLGTRGENVTIIGMSANVVPERIQAFRAAGIDDHLGKPFRRAQLIGKMTEWLRQLAEVPAPAPDVPAGAEPRSSHGPTEVQELLDLMGKDWVLTGLDILKSQIDEAFGRDEPPELELLARRAHALVSQAAVLGFRDLSSHCSRLEEACSSNGPVDHAYRRARAVALATIRLADDLKARLQGHGRSPSDR